MANSSDVTSIILTTYYGMEEMKPMYFCIILFLYLFVIVENSMLMRVICVEKSLHEPMYLLVCNLAANGLYGGTGLLPAMLCNILSHTHEISLPYCKLQIFAFHTYAFIECTILSAMSYDRYVAICHPLQYHAIMSLTKVYKIIVLIWLCPMIIFFLHFYSTVLQLRFCKNSLDNLYCINYALIKLACTDPYVYNVAGVVCLFLYTAPQLGMIIYSYIRIFIIIASSSKESKIKALKTCGPHLVVVTSYYIGGYLEVLQTRFDISHLPYRSRLFFALFYVVCPLVLNPAIYGVCIEAIRRPLFKMFQGKKKSLIPI